MKALVFLYAIIILAGGLSGYVFAGSIPSLIAGLVFGAIIASAGILMRFRFNAGRYAALSAALFLTLFFAVKFFKTYTFLPAGLLALISLFTASILAMKKSSR